MPRDIPVGNGSLLVNFDDKYQLRDLYWPHVGMENHTNGHPFRFGVWTDGRFSWIDEEGWERSFTYEKDLLVTEVTLHHPGLNLRMRCFDVVDFYENLYVRCVDVESQTGRAGEVRLFFSHDFHISGHVVGDSAYYEPERRGVFHYKGKRWFLINAAKEGADGLHIGIDQWAIGIKELLDRTRSYWKLWAEREDETPGESPLTDIPEDISTLYRRSLLIIRTQIDNDGAIIAANDHDSTGFSGDTYSYMWPRDGALVATALIDAGYSEVTRRFFDFCRNAIMEEGYFLHKYNPDGSIASSWHGWYQDGKKSLPVQEDETALVIWVLWRHYLRFHDVEFIKPLYRGLIIRAANWLESYRDPDDRLPIPSWDLWEERRGIHSWTVGATWMGLHSAANFTQAFGEKDLADRYRRVAQEIKGAAKNLCMRKKKGVSPAWRIALRRGVGKSTRPYSEI